MPSPLCPQLQTEYLALKAKKQEFVSVFQKVKETDSPRDLKQAKKLMKELKEQRVVLQEKLFPKEIKGTWENPQTLERKETVFNVKQEIDYFKDFYKTRLNLELTGEQEREIKRIFQKHKKEMKEEMEKYGYDAILIVPENLPDLHALNKELIETMEEPGNGEVSKTYQTEDFKNEGGFSGVKNTEAKKLRVVFTKNAQNTYQSNDPIIEATLNKKIWNLCGLKDEDEVKERIANLDPLPMDFTEEIVDKNGNKKQIHIKSERLSLEQYIIFQRVYFDKSVKKDETKPKHLDEKGWTRLLKSLSGERLVASGWSPGRRGLDVLAAGPYAFIDDLGGRPSRSFCI